MLIILPFHTKHLLGQKRWSKARNDQRSRKKVILAESYYEQVDMAVNKVALEIGVSKMTPYKYLRYLKVEIGNYVHQNDSKSQVIEIQ